MLNFHGNSMGKTRMPDIFKKVLRHFSTTPNNPVMRYTHDCEDCIPLGRHGKYDLYYCKQEAMGRPTLIARWGDNGPDYKSGMGFVGYDLEITRAFTILIKGV
jgi:hypothetical protein